MAGISLFVSSYVENPDCGRLVATNFSLYATQTVNDVLF